MNNKKLLILVVGLLVVLMGLTGCSNESELMQEAKSAQKEEIVGTLVQETVVALDQYSEDAVSAQSTGGFQWTSEAEDVIMDVLVNGEWCDDNDFHQVTSQLEYDSYVKAEFESLNSAISIVDNGNGYAQMDVGNVEGQCVAFVQAVTGNYTGEKYWQKGDPVTESTDIQPGTAIATNFGANGVDHAAIYLATFDGYIAVIDQNWPKDGSVSLHRITFGGSGVIDAGEYYTVKGYLILGWSYVLQPD